jgi:hypothetical protein
VTDATAADHVLLPHRLVERGTTAEPVRGRVGVRARRASL